jgi:AcrR family transcriptional regulator
VFLSLGAAFYFWSNNSPVLAESILTKRSACDILLLTVWSATINLLKLEDSAVPIQLYEKEEILEACLGVFAHNGYANTTTAMLAEAAGTSKALIFHHFGNKKALYLALVAQCIENGRAALGIATLDEYRGLDFFAARERFSLNKYRFNRDHPTAYQLLKEAFFATPAEIQAEIATFYGTLMGDRHLVWWELFAAVPLRAGVDRKQAFELVTLAIEHFERKYLAEMLNATELDEAQVQAFLVERKQFLALIRFGIEDKDKTDERACQRI